MALLHAAQHTIEAATHAAKTPIASVFGAGAHAYKQQQPSAPTLPENISAKASAFASSLPRAFSAVLQTLLQRPQCAVSKAVLHFQHRSCQLGVAIV